MIVHLHGREDMHKMANQNTCSFLLLATLLAATSLLAQSKTSLEDHTKLTPAQIKQDQLNMKMSNEQQSALQKQPPTSSQPYIQPIQPMTCYVCSTMDYENTADNLCRNMVLPGKTLPSFHQNQELVTAGQWNIQPGGLPAQTNLMAGGGMASQALNPNSLKVYDETGQPYHHNTYSDSDSSSNNNHNGTIRLHNSSPLSLQNGQFDNGNNQSLEYRSASNISDIDRHQMQQQYSTAHQGLFAQHRHLPQANYIKTRECGEDENFCSLVTITRIEHGPDRKPTVKFWALERNCSKSCNTGCMLIGEKVRLKVCGTCCRKPNCNYGNGSSVSLIASSNGILATALISSLWLVLIEMRVKL